MKALAIDFGGTHATLGVVSDRELLAHKSIDTDRARSLRALLPVLRQTFQELLSRCAVSASDCAGVAIGLAALVDARTTTVLATNGKYDDARDLDLVAWSREAFGLPIRLENDARMALLGETYAGAAKGCENVVMVTLGTGIGGVTMIEGKLLRGKHAQAGCLGGHLPVLLNGRACTCGAIGCAEAEAAGWSLPLVVRDWPGASQSSLAQHPDISFRELFQEADRGDPVAIAVRDRCLQVWAVDAVALVHAYDPEIVVIGGGVMKRADLIVPYVERYVQQHAWTPWGKVQVRAAALGNEAALLGAVPLLSETF